MQPSLPTEAQFHNCFYLELRPHWTSQPHHHQEHELMLVARGRMSVEVGNCLLTGQPGSLFVLPIGWQHISLSCSQETLQLLVFRWRGGETLFVPTSPGVFVDQRGYIRQQLIWALDLHPTNDLPDIAMLHVLSHTIIHELRRLTQSPVQDLATRVRRYIRANLGRRIYLEELAQEEGMSKFHFGRIFKQVTGQTPIQMVNQMRIEAATEYLLFTDHTLDKIAHDLGFTDTSHFCHMFRRLTNATPGSMRKDRDS